MPLAQAASAHFYSHRNMAYHISRRLQEQCPEPEAVGGDDRAFLINVAKVSARLHHDQQYSRRQQHGVSQPK